jgi:CRISPR system Cascade subunit CasD
MARFLIFQLAGPMASWGEIAVGEDRGSAPRPTRSAILGILASALGIRRSHEEAQRSLAMALRLAVVVCDTGLFLRDYHTTQVPSSVATKGWSVTTRRDEMEVIAWSRRAKGQAGEAILSFRDYRCDGRWIVAVESVPDGAGDLDRLCDALRTPALTPFLGRKACPLALPMEPQVVEAGDLIHALKVARFTPIEATTTIPRRGRPRPNQLSLYWEAGVTVGVDPIEKTDRRDDPLSRSRWQFQPRTEFRALLPGEVQLC